MHWIAIGKILVNLDEVLYIEERKDSYVFHLRHRTTEPLYIFKTQAIESYMEVLRLFVTKG